MTTTQTRLFAVPAPDPTNPLTWTVEERDLLARHRAGQTIVVNMKHHDSLVSWAKSAGLFVRIDRRSKWGNPFRIGGDGDRATVIARYRDYLAHQPRLDPSDLTGRILGCWCHPAPCHGHVLAEEADRDV